MNITILLLLPGNVDLPALETSGFIDSSLPCAGLLLLSALDYNEPQSYLIEQLSGYVTLKFYVTV